jgi:hypothetical protein
MECQQLKAPLETMCVCQKLAVKSNTSQILKFGRAELLATVVAQQKHPNAPKYSCCLPPGCGKYQMPPE